jgi:hypothetical protein
LGKLIEFEEAKENVLDKIRRNPIVFQYDVLRNQLISMGMKEGSETLESVLIFVRQNSINSVKNEFYIGQR